LVLGLLSKSLVQLAEGPLVDFLNEALRGFLNRPGFAGGSNS